MEQDNKYLGGKLAATYEFKDETKKTKDFYIAIDFRGVEPEEDKVSKYADQARYKLTFGDDDNVITGCYRE